ncbi:hypothetical protein [uncultured Ramlibacter sp.]|uniref:hypothetical protein n=1 Tax=uncultured Ramlibacter sp. TaxID=260755 RepID=UPI00345C50D0
MFDVPSEELEREARPHGLLPVAHLATPDLQGRSDVTWTRLVLQAGECPSLLF